MGKTNPAIAFIANEIRFCKCGCGRQVKFNLRYTQKCSGHLDGFPDYISGHNPPWNKGLTKETDTRVEKIAIHLSVTKKGKVSIWNKGLTKLNDNRIARYSSILKGKKRSALTRQKISVWHKGKRLSQKTIEKIIASRLGYRHSIETRKKISLGNKGRKTSPESRRKMSLKKSHFWEGLSSEEKSTRIKRMMLSANRKPNKVEQLLNSILQENFPNEWKYVGNGNLIIGGKCPDFTNINGHKLLIELFGTFWHRNETGQDRIELFRTYGFETLIIWQNELCNPVLIKEKIEKWQEHIQS